MPTNCDDLLAELEGMPVFLAGAFERLSAEDARRPGPGGGFAPVEQCWHLAELEVEGFGQRIRLLLESAGPFLPDFDGARLARERQYLQKSLSDGVRAFGVARAANLALLRSAGEVEWSRRGVQEGVGPVTLFDLPRLMRDHDASHRAEIIDWLRVK